MPRRNRPYIPGFLWHVTHRCHKKEYLLKFEKDKKRWRNWLFEAKKRFGLKILTYCVTANHIHLLAVDSKKGIISRSMQLVSGRTAQAYNSRKNRKGAFWEDRYNATAIEDGVHLLRCMVYIDLNMVRAGVVKHPSEWGYCGYNEILNPPQRYALIDRKALLTFCGFSDLESFRRYYRAYVEDCLINSGLKREGLWTESLAVGSQRYLKTNGKQLGIKTKMKPEEPSVFSGSRTDYTNGSAFDGKFSVDEEKEAYSAVFDPEKMGLKRKNDAIWVGLS